jgi:hypothetical protein
MILHLLMRKIRQTTNSLPSARKKFLSMIERQISQSEGLTWSALADAPSGTIIIFARPEYLCANVLESEDISEIALTRRAPDVNIVSSSGVLLIGRKQ